MDLIARRMYNVTAADVIEKALVSVSIVKEIILNKHNDKNSVCYYTFFVTTFCSLRVSFIAPFKSVYKLQ